jgi:hypothetical protein
MAETHIQIDVRDARSAYESPSVRDLGKATEMLIETVRRVSLDGTTAPQVRAGL